MSQSCPFYLMRLNLVLRQLNSLKEPSGNIVSLGKPINTGFSRLTWFAFFRLPTNHAALSILHCKEKTVSESECRSTRYNGRIERTPLLKFLQSQILPKYVSRLIKID